MSRETPGLSLEEFPWTVDCGETRRDRKVGIPASIRCRTVCWVVSGRYRTDMNRVENQNLPRTMIIPHDLLALFACSHMCVSAACVRLLSCFAHALPLLHRVLNFERHTLHQRIYADCFFKSGFLVERGEFLMHGTLYIIRDIFSTEHSHPVAIAPARFCFYRILEFPHFRGCAYTVRFSSFRGKRLK